MALLVDAANQALTLDTGDDQKSLVPITNPRVRRRERQGAGLKAAAGTTAVAKPKPAVSKPGQPLALGKPKAESKPAQPVQETAEKSSSSGPAKKAAPPLKRGASSGIMQAFSKAAAMPAKPKKEAPQPAVPSDEDLSAQPMSDDGEDDEELPQPKPRSTSGFKSKKQREEELKRMMEEDDEEEEASERAETPIEEAMEEEPLAPEPAKEEETEVVTASANGRRRGRRQVMRKKQLMDDQGYLGTCLVLGWAVTFLETNPTSQSRFKNSGGSHSQKMSLPRRQSLRQRVRRPPRRLRSRRRAAQRGRAASCRFSPRSDWDCFGAMLAAEADLGSQSADKHHPQYYSADSQWNDGELCFEINPF